MTSPPVATSATDRTEVRRRNWAGEPGLILGEDRQGYDELLAQVSRALAPRNVMEDVWIRDVVDLVWDIFGCAASRQTCCGFAPGTPSVR